VDPVEWNFVKLTDLKGLESAQTALKQVLSFHQGSLSTAVSALFPQETVPKLTKEYWKSMENQRKFFDKLQFLLGLESVEGWYSVDDKEVIERGGLILLNQYYEGFLIKALQTMYLKQYDLNDTDTDRHPQRNWKVYKFSTIPQTFWSNINHQKLFLDQLAPEFNIQDQRDWNRVNIQQIVDKNGGPLLALYGNSLTKRTYFLVHV
jgi:hypothetical protein